MQCMTNAIPAGGSSWTPDPVLENNSWDDIQRASDEGIASSVFSVGDTKGVPLNGTVGILSLNTTLYVFILGFDHNAELEGSGITFGGFKTADGKDVCLCDSSYNSNGASAAFYMNTSNINTGGWKNSYMRNNICGTSKTITSGTVMGIIPTELLNVIKSVKKYTNNTGQNTSSGAVTATDDLLFIPSEKEVFGSVSYANSYEANYQQQYAYYSNGNSKVKYRHNSTGNTATWWLRSSDVSVSSRFVFVFTDGTVLRTSAHLSLGFALCFVV